MTPTLSTMTLAIGFVFLIIGLLFRIFSPRKINSVYGYRTSSAKRNIDTWRTANKYSASLMLLEGIILIIIGFIALQLPDSGVIGAAFGFALFFASIIILAVLTEKHLNKLFDKDGNRK